MFRTETVLATRRWGDRMFSFTTTRAPSFRFENGQFIMLGLHIAGRPVMRPYSIVSPNYDDHLEYLSIVTPDGELTPALGRIAPGDQIIMSGKPTGTLLPAYLHPGRNLYLVATGTGLAPFLSIVRDPDVYDRFDRIILVHSVRYAEDLAYQGYIRFELGQHNLVGESVKQKLTYVAIVTRGSSREQDRIPRRVEDGRLASECGLKPVDPLHDRFMICGNPAMLADMCALLDRLGFKASKGVEGSGDYVYERAFVETPYRTAAV